MKHGRVVKIQKLQNKNKMMGSQFSVLDKNHRREFPWLGNGWFAEGMDEERKAYIAAWKKETARLKASNPNLVII